MAWPAANLEPLIHLICDFNREKLIRHLTVFISWLYGWSCFAASIDTNLRYVTWAAFPILPAAAKTRGERTMFHLTEALLIASPLFFPVVLVRGSEALGTVCGYKWVKNPHVNKCILWSLPEPLPPDVHSCSILAVGWSSVRYFPRQWLQFRLQKWGLLWGLKLLCLNVGIPPVGQVKACSTVRFFPHTHTLGIVARCHPYCRATASWKGPLCRKELIHWQNTYAAGGTLLLRKIHC